MGKQHAPRPPELLRKSGPHKDRSKYDRKQARATARRERTAADTASHGKPQDED